MAMSFAVYAFVYYRWFIPKRSKLVAEQVEKLTLARKAMSEAVSYIATYEAELARLSAETAARQEEVRLLKQLSSENSSLLEERLRGMELLARNRIWFERAFAFVIGILSSIAASYIWLAIQPRP